jgi:hypothetical protein
MKRNMLFAAAAILALSSGLPAYAADTCKEEIAAVELKWKGYSSEVNGIDGSAWKSVGDALGFAKISCNAGRENEAFKTVNLMHRWMGDNEHQTR